MAPGNFEKYSATFKSIVIRGFNIKADIWIVIFPKIGTILKIELKNPIKLIIPINGTTTMFAKTL